MYPTDELSSSTRPARPHEPLKTWVAKAAVPSPSPVLDVPTTSVVDAPKVVVHSVSLSKAALSTADAEPQKMHLRLHAYERKWAEPEPRRMRPSTGKMIINRDSREPDLDSLYYAPSNAHGQKSKLSRAACTRRDAPTASTAHVPKAFKAHAPASSGAHVPTASKAHTPTAFMAHAPIASRSHAPLIVTRASNKNSIGLTQVLKCRKWVNPWSLPQPLGCRSRTQTKSGYQPSDDKPMRPAWLHAYSGSVSQ